MLEWMKDHWHQRRDLEEIDAMTESELSDIGASRDQLRNMVRMPEGVSRRMTSMARVFGLPEGRIAENRAEYVELLTRCSQCNAISECENELAKGPNADPWDCPFCVNSGRFIEMAEALA